jgi:hypothetical protein
VPRKVRHEKRRIEDPDALFPELIDVLLEGWFPARGVTQYPGSDPFRVFQFKDDATLERLWKKHRAELLRIAAERGLPRPVHSERRYELQRPAWLGPVPVTLH